MTSGIKEKNTGRLFFKIFLEKQKQKGKEKENR